MSPLLRSSLVAGLAVFALTACDTLEPRGFPDDLDTSSSVDTTTTATDTDAVEDTTPLDPCLGVANPCTDAGATSCDGTRRVVCQLDANDCLVETRQDCASTGELCEDGACRAPDPCADVEQPCPSPLRACDGDALVSCAPDANGCLVLSRFDCTQLDGTCTTTSAGEVRCGGTTTTCDGVERPCTQPGWRMCGDTTTGGERVVTCDYDENGCLAEREQPCVTPRTCVQGASPGLASCIEPCSDDPGCPGVAPDDPPQRECVGDVVRTCDDVDDDGCVELVEVACGAGNTCVDDPTAGPVCDVMPETTFGTNPFTEGAPETFLALSDGDAFDVTQGFQGTWMFVIALRSRGMFSGQVTMAVEVTVGDPTSAEALERSLELGGVGLQDGGDGYFYVFDYMLDLGVFDAPAMGTPVDVRISIEDQLGTTWSQALDMTVGEAKGF